MIDDEYYKLVNKMDNEYDKKHKYDKVIKYLKNNHLAIIAIIISLFALFK